MHAAYTSSWAAEVATGSCVAGACEGRQGCSSGGSPAALAAGPHAGHRGFPGSCLWPAARADPGCHRPMSGLASAGCLSLSVCPCYMPGSAGIKQQSHMHASLRWRS